MKTTNSLYWQCQFGTPRIKVCSQNVLPIDAESACNVLGYTGGGSFSQMSMLDRWTKTEIPQFSTWRNTSSAEDCDHGQNVLLTCFESGKEILSLSDFISSLDRYRTKEINFLISLAWAGGLEVSDSMLQKIN